jgi:teichuronic acid biosynthesis glycosyltransferase TuaG
MKITGLVSIITPAYNSEKTIKATIDSVLAQTYSQWELLVVIDEGTQDSTSEIVNQWNQKDPRIQLLKVPSGKGLALSRNFALSQSQGQYVAFLDSDDVWLADKLTEQINFLVNQKAALSCHAFRRIDFEGTKTGQLIDVPSNITYQTLLKNNVMGCLTVLVDQTQTGPLQFEETKHEDYLLWLKLLKAGHKCVGLKKDLARYRIVPTSRSANKVEMTFMRWKILRFHEHLNVLKSFYYLGAYVMSSLLKYRRF